MCKIVEKKTETQYIEIYERMKQTQTETYNKYIEKHKDDIDFKMMSFKQWRGKV